MHDLYICKIYFTETRLLIAASKGQSKFRLIGYENEWNVVKTILIPPSPFGRGDVTSAKPLLDPLKSSTDTRLLVVFCPTWAVSKLMELTYCDGMDMGNWTWIFSDLGNKKVKREL